MKIGVIRHARVIYRDPIFTTGKAFADGRVAYDSIPVEMIELSIKTEDYPVCYVSSKMRAIETARMIYAGDLIVTDDLVEIKSVPFFLQKIKIPTIFRKVISVITWFFNYQKMPETKKQSYERAHKFITRLLSETQKDTLLVTHGFFMHCLKRELRKQGFKGNIPYAPKNAQFYLFEKK